MGGFLRSRHRTRLKSDILQIWGWKGGRRPSESISTSTKTVEKVLGTKHIAFMVRIISLYRQVYVMFGTFFLLIEWIKTCSKQP